MTDTTRLWDTLLRTPPKTRQRAKAAIAIMDEVQGTSVYRPTEAMALKGLATHSTKRWSSNVSLIIGLLEDDGTIKLEYDTSILLALSMLDGLKIREIGPDTVEIRRHYIVLKGAVEIAKYISTLEGMEVTTSQVARAISIVKERHDEQEISSRRRVYRQP